MLPKQQFGTRRPRNRTAQSSLKSYNEIILTLMCLGLIVG